MRAMKDQLALNTQPAFKKKSVMVSRKSAATARIVLCCAFFLGCCAAHFSTDIPANDTMALLADQSKIVGRSGVGSNTYDVITQRVCDPPSKAFNWERVHMSVVVDWSMHMLHAACVGEVGKDTESPHATDPKCLITCKLISCSASCSLNTTL